MRLVYGNMLRATEFTVTVLFERRSGNGAAARALVTGFCFG